MAKRKSTLFQDLTRQAMVRCLVSLSQNGHAPEVTMGNFPDYLVYPSRRDGFDLSCDLGCKLAKDQAGKEEQAKRIFDLLPTIWSNSPFSEIVQEGGFLHFKLPAGISL